MFRGTGIRLSLIVLAVVLSALGVRQPLVMALSNYGSRGQYAVGEKNLTIGDQKMTVSVWYPALGDKNQQIVYEITMWPGSPESPLVGTGQAIQDGRPDAARGPYPLVVVSPGLFMSGKVYSYLGEQLASHGFVVIGLDARGESFPDSSFWQGAAFRRIDLNTAIVNARQVLPGLIDVSRVGVVGHSSGGWAALVSGGAQMDLRGCTPSKMADPLGNCAQFVPHVKEIAGLLGLETARHGLWPSSVEPGLKAIVAMAPDGDIWGSRFDGVESERVPVLVMAGTADTLNPPGQTSYPIYVHLDGSKRLVRFKGGDHFMFMDDCNEMPWLALIGACSNGVWSHEAVNQVVTTFFMDRLKDDPMAHADMTERVAPTFMPGNK